MAHVLPLQGAAETLEQLWISYNQIDKLKPIRNLACLHTLYMAHNLVTFSLFYSSAIYEL